MVVVVVDAQRRTVKRGYYLRTNAETQRLVPSLTHCSYVCRPPIPTRTPLPPAAPSVALVRSLSLICTDW